MLYYLSNDIYGLNLPNFKKASEEKRSIIHLPTERTNLVQVQVYNRLVQNPDTMVSFDTVELLSVTVQLMVTLFEYTDRFGIHRLLYNRMA